MCVPRPPLLNMAPATPKPFRSREGLNLEFKEAARDLPRGFFESVCAFLNLDGGLIILGVADDGAVRGLEPDAVQRLKTEIANQSNNPNKLDPPYLLFPRAEKADGLWIIKVQVPASSSVHRVGGEVFLRSDEGDYRLKDPYQIAGLVNRKLSFYTEQRVLPWLQMNHLRRNLFDRSRELFRAQRHDHPWLTLKNDEVLRIGGFVRKDPLTGDAGYTLAAALMFGTDDTIQQAAPGMTFDALLRRVNPDRYDDRLLLHTNLIDTFDLLMGFVEKHLNDPFYLEGTTRVSLRDRIFRELVSNLIAHREYTSAAPATMTIHRDRVVFRNPHVPHLRGRIDPADFTPFPKNPTICRFMLQLGRYEQIGSGVFNVSRYLPRYTEGAIPHFEEQVDLFITVIPLTPSSDQPTRQVPDKYPTSTRQVLARLAESEHPLTRAALQDAAGLRDREHFANEHLKPLLAEGLVEQTIPDKPRSRLQRYRLTPKGRALLEHLTKENPNRAPVLSQ